MMPFADPSPKVRLKVLLAYFDESGKLKDHDFICLAGFITEESRNAVLSTTWRALLEHHGIPYVHMADLAFGAPPYDAKGWTAEQKRDVVCDFTTAVGKYILRGVGIGVDAKAYKLMRKESRDAIGDPRTFCFARAIRRVMDSLREWNCDEPVPLMFDDDQDCAMKYYSLYGEIKRHDADAKRLLPSITFADDDVFYSLQAADTIAYATFREQRRGANAWNERSWYRNILLAQRNPIFGRQYVSEYWDADGLKLADKSSIKAIIDSPAPPDVIGTDAP